MIGRVIIGGLLGLVVGAVATFGLGLALAEIVSISQAEGAYAMGLAFFWTPLGAVAGLVAGAIVAARRAT